MATNHYTLTVTSTPIRIAKGVGGDALVYVYLSNGTGDDCFIGDSSVTATGVNKGFAVHKYVSGSATSVATFVLSSNDELYAVTDAAKTTDLTVLITNV